MNKPTIQTDEHVFISGQTGTGKSFLAELYLSGYDHVIKLDTKGETYERRRDNKSPWTGLIENKDFTVIENLVEIDTVQTDKIIYVPDFDEQNQDFYNSLFKWVYDRENTIVWIDELMSISENPQRYPTYLKALMTRGRSRNSVVWSLTQRPMDIPSIVLANSSHFFIFDMNLPQDRKKISDATGVPEFLEKPGFRNFWYFKTGNERPVRATLNVQS